MHKVTEPPSGRAGIDSLTHAVPTGAHSGPCTPICPHRLAPRRAFLLPAHAHPRKPSGRSTPHQASDPSVLHPHNAPAPTLHPQGSHGVRVRSCPRCSRGRQGSHGGLASIPRSFPAGYSRKPLTAGPAATYDISVGAALPTGTKPLHGQRPAYGSLVQSRGSARTKLSINVF